MLSILFVTPSNEKYISTRAGNFRHQIIYTRISYDKNVLARFAQLPFPSLIHPTKKQIYTRRGQAHDRRIDRPTNSLRFSERTTTTFPGPRAEARGPPRGTMTGDTDTVSLSLDSLSAAVPTSLMVQPIICYDSGGGGGGGRITQKTGAR